MFSARLSVLFLGFLVTGCEVVEIIDDRALDCPTGAEYLFCEGFESDLPGNADTLNSTKGVSFSRSFDQVRSGTAALRVEIPPSESQETQYVHLEKRLLEPISSGTIFSRLYLYLEPGFQLDQWLVLLSLRNQGDLFIKKLSIDLVGDDTLQLANDNSKRYYSSEKQVFSRGRWICLEASFTISDTQGQMELWLDGNPIIQGNEADQTQLPGGVNLIQFGVVNTQPPLGSTPIELYLDGYVVDTKKRIGCR